MVRQAPVLSHHHPHWRRTCRSPPTSRLLHRRAWRPMGCLCLPLQSPSPTPALNSPTAASSSSCRTSFPTWYTTSTQQGLRIILLLFLHLSFRLLPPCKFSGLCPPTRLLLRLQKPSLVVFPLKLLPNPRVHLLFQLPSHLCRPHSPTSAMGRLRSSKVSQQDIPQISHLPLCQSSTASPPKTSPSLPPLPPSPLRPLPPLWSNRSSISSRETLPHLLCLPPTPWRDPSSPLLSLHQRSRPNQSGSQEVLWLRSPQSSPHLLLTTPWEISLLLPLHPPPRRALP